MKIAVCDDNRELAEYLQKQLKEIVSADLLCDFFQNGENLLDALKIERECYDLIFLDIEMSGINGIETANAIREFNEQILIVFLTSHSLYMKDSFQCMPFRFMLKPVDVDELEKVLYAAKKKIDKLNQVLVFREQKSILRLYKNRIIYFESMAPYLIIHTIDGEYKVRLTMNHLQIMLNDSDFFRIHKSYIVNFNYVKSLGDQVMYLYHEDNYLPIGRKYKNEVTKEFTLFMERMVR